MVRIELPGDLVNLGFSAQIRARGEKDQVKVVASTANGLSWCEVAVLAGPTQGRTEHIRAGQWPPNTGKVLLRFELTGNNTTPYKTSASMPTTATLWPPRRFVPSASSIAGAKEARQ